MTTRHPHSSRQRYRGFLEDYRHGRLDAKVEAEESGNGKRPDGAAVAAAAAVEEPRAPWWQRLRRGVKGVKREYLREYLRWLRPHRGMIGVVLLLALLRAGMEMIEPLFMRYIVDRVLLDTTLDTAARLRRLHVAGATFLAVI